MTRLLVALLVLVVLLPSPHPAAATAQAETWPTGTPEAHGFDSASLADVLPTIQKQVPRLHSLLMIGDGEAFLDASFYPYDGTTPHDLASVTKSVTTTLIGIAIDQGRLSLDDPALSFFPGRTIAHRDARKEALTVGDLASMQTGLDCVWQPYEPTLAAMEASPDPVQFTLDLPMVAEPGTTWEYCSPGMHLLSAILTRATGMTELDFAWQYLFGPLGMREVIWPADPQGVTHGWGDLMLRPHDAAKLGQLWLNGGEWERRRIVSKAWVDAAVSSQATTSVENQDYGYGWWIERESEVGGQYAAEGRGGQYVVVYPALKLVVTITGNGDFGIGDVTDRLAPALTDAGNPLPENPAAVDRLHVTIARLAEAPPAEKVPPLPAVAERISGIAYTMVSNPANIESIRFEVTGATEMTVTIALADEPAPIVAAIGLDGVYRFAPGENGLPTAARGQWEDERTFVFNIDNLANLNRYTVRSRFEGDAIAVEITDHESGEVIPLKGTATPR